ncbi:MAG: hypothetical protein H6737_10720 [Alphaproteobacteria bacterium]|nr:hypothetical protein [Alphaproteobacteria bacterium]
MSNRARALGASLLLFVLPADALAQDACETPMKEQELRDLVAQAVAAIDAEDDRAHRQVFETLEKRIPCLDGQMPSRPWADFLVTEALIRYADQLPDWQRPLKLALDLVPDHPDVPPWLLEEYLEPADPTGASQPVPSGQVVVVDGRVVVGDIPPLAGIHVVQTIRDGKWNSRLVKGQPFPPEWLPKPDVPKVKVTDAYSSWGAAGLDLGLGRWGQRPPTDGADGLIDERSFPGAGIGVSTHGQQSIAGPVGVFWTVDGSLQSSALADANEAGRRMVPFGSGFAGVALFDQPISIWLGGGVGSTRISTFEGEKYIALGHYLAGVSFRSRDPIGIDVFGGGGWGPWGAHFQAKAGATVLDLGPVGLRIGARANLADATLVNYEPDDRPVIGRSSRWEGGIDVGMSWGVAE